ncbi:hypothetical protein Mapa_007196 [Marchantia paleacea]|nr:hypothetical protein Mapa_007196 [Marchantia paleacea]
MNAFSITKCCLNTHVHGPHSSSALKMTNFSGHGTQRAKSLREPGPQACTLVSSPPRKQFYRTRHSCLTDARFPKAHNDSSANTVFYVLAVVLEVVVLEPSIAQQPPRPRRNVPL